MDFASTGLSAPLVDNTANFRDIPPVASVTVNSSVDLRVTFSEPMTNDVELIDPSNYSFTTPDGVGILCNAVTPEGVAEPNYVDLVVTEMTEGAAYELFVNAAITDLDGSSVEESADFIGQGTKPRISSAVPQNSTTVRINFNEPMDPNAGQLINAANYSITPSGGAAPVNVNEVSAFGPTPSWVDLLTSEMTDGGSYTCTVDTGGDIRDAARNPLDPGFASDSFTGVGQAPTVLRLVSQSSNRIDVVFSEPMTDNADIRNPANYAFDGGLAVLDVLEVEGDTVKLVTTDQNPDQLYTVTIG
jgi:hypothetical protein